MPEDYGLKPECVPARRRQPARVPLLPGLHHRGPGYSSDAKRMQAGHDEPIKVAYGSLDAGRYIVSTVEQWRSELRTLTPSF